MYKISKMVCASKTAFASNTAFASKLAFASKIAFASKTAFVSKIALATTLLGFLFIGGASLQAQEGSENGWFVSVSPLIFGASKIETKTTIAGVVGGEVTVGDFTAIIRNLNIAVSEDAQKLAIDLCEGTLAQSVLDNVEIVYLAEDRSDATDLKYNTGVGYEAIRFRLNGNEIPFTGSPGDIASMQNTNVSPIPDSACKDAFDGLRLHAPGSSSAGKALAGNGFQVGYRNGDYRYSLTNYSWAADSDKLDLQLAMIEYYLAKGFLLGLGAANVKLDSSIGSQSQGAIAFSIGYQYPLFKNFFVEANYTLIQTDLSLQKETNITEAAISQTDTREIGFIARRVISGGINHIVLDEGTWAGDKRVTVTRNQSRSAVQATQTKTVEVKNLNIWAKRDKQTHRAGTGHAPTGDNVPCIFPVYSPIFLPEFVGEFYSQGGGIFHFHCFCLCGLDCASALVAGDGDSFVTCPCSFV